MRWHFSLSLLFSCAVRLPYPLSTRYSALRCAAYGEVGSSRKEWAKGTREWTMKQKHILPSNPSLPLALIHSLSLRGFSPLLLSRHFYFLPNSLHTRSRALIDPSYSTPQFSSLTQVLTTTPTRNTPRPSPTIHQKDSGATSLVLSQSCLHTSTVTRSTLVHADDQAISHQS
ncbi:hypothetical protein LZ30DRAFT_1544 [Colletotrichum cereale]|nr:hypothetical protein LZ30DRAFT_1544 [Colletotrichum cereale]